MCILSVFSFTGSSALQAIYNENWSCCSDVHTDTDLYITPETLPTVLSTLVSLGGIMTGKHKDYIDLQKGLTPYMTNDIMCVLRFVLMPTVQFWSFADSVNTPNEAVTIDADGSEIHLMTECGLYVPYIPSLQTSRSHTKVDLIVSHCPCRVIKQFDLEICSNYIDMGNGRLVMANPPNTCLRLTQMNATDRNSRVLSYFLKLAKENR